MPPTVRSRDICNVYADLTPPANKCRCLSSHGRVDIIFWVPNRAEAFPRCVNTGRATLARSIRINVESTPNSNGSRMLTDLDEGRLPLHA